MKTCSKCGDSTSYGNICRPCEIKLEAMWEEEGHRVPYQDFFNIPGQSEPY